MSFRISDLEIQQTVKCFILLNYSFFQSLKIELGWYESKYKHFCTQLKSIEFEISINFQDERNNSEFDEIRESKDGNQLFGKFGNSRPISKEEESLIRAQKQMRLAQDITININQELDRNNTTFGKIISTVKFSE